MNHPSIVSLFVLSLTLATAVPAQNLLFHNDGVQEGFSRGPGLLTSTLTVIQRFPEEQWCGRQCLECVTIDFRDLSPGTAEPFSIEVRKGIGLANSPADAPDMTAFGLLAAPIPWLKPAGPASILMTIPVGPCLPLPPGIDVYICVVLPGPTGDLRVWFSNNEVYRGSLPTLCGPPPGRYRLWPDLGLSWVYDATGPTLQTTKTWLGGPPGPNNYSWAIGASLLEDVCQAFAGSAAAGPANYGYAGIYPDLGRFAGTDPDRVGFRLRSSHPAGSPCVLFLGVVKFGVPIDLSTFNALWSGFLCIDPLVAVSLVTGPGEGRCISTSKAVVGPLVLPPGLCGLDFCAQFISVDPIPFTLRASTACLVDL